MQTRADSEVLPGSERGTGIKFSRETARGVWSELDRLSLRHWTEIAVFPDQPLGINTDFYYKADEIGIMRLFTVRKEGELVGYAVYMVHDNPHYKQVKQASQDTLFLRKDCRGASAIKFLRWCDEELAKEGVKAIVQHVKTTRDFSPVLKRMGYVKTDELWTRRLKT